MKIYGPYTRKDQRQHIVIVHDDGRKQTKSYPRYLLEQHLGRELTPDETVDHIDNNKLNNELSNLQILSLSDNAKKQMELSPRELYHFDCPVCKNPSVKFLSDVEGNRKKGKAGPFCSKRCAGKYSTMWSPII